MNELLPCPFCGDAARLEVWHDPQTILHPWYRVQCENCGCAGPGTDRGTHVEQWNTRAAALTPKEAE